MLGEGGHGGGESDGEAGVEKVSESEDGEFGNVDGAAVAFPEEYGAESGKHRDKPAGKKDKGFGRDACEGGDALLQFEFQRAALTVANDDADGHKGQQKDRGDFA